MYVRACVHVCVKMCVYYVNVCMYVSMCVCCRFMLVLRQQGDGYVDAIGLFWL